jgi:hypothetical protein
VSPNRVRTKELDEACARAFDLARAAAENLAGPGQLGPLVGSEADGDRLVTHMFACLDPAYAGWRWAVTVARASRSKLVTVSESVLLPGPDSLLAPDWVPWSERVRPGDLGVGDLLPAGSDDERLVPVAMLEGADGVLTWDDSASWAEGTIPAAGLTEGTTLMESPVLEEGPALAESAVLPDSAVIADSPGPADAAVTDLTRPADALAAGREGRPPRAARPAASGPASRRTRVLSAIGRDLAAERWYSSEHGPGSPLASAAPGPCSTCGFLVSLSGPLGRVFGVCANEYAPDDGRVVALDHGCGAHSEATTPGASRGAPVPVIDELGYDLVDAPGVSMADTVFESLE